MSDPEPDPLGSDQTGSGRPAEQEDAAQKSGDEAATRVVPAHEPRSPVRTFTYLVVALLPFVAFILMLPRGGGLDGEPEKAAQSASPSPISTLAVPLAFPFDMTPPDESPPAPEVVQMEESRVPQCSDGTDNDGDRRTDFGADSGCSSRTDNSESSARVRAQTSPAAAQPAPAPPAPAPRRAAPAQSADGDDDSGEAGESSDGDDSGNRNPPENRNPPDNSNQPDNRTPPDNPDRSDNGDTQTDPAPCTDEDIASGFLCD